MQKLSNSDQNRRHQVLVDVPVQIGVALRLIGLWAGTTLVAAFFSVVLQFFADPMSSFLSHLATFRNWMPSLIAFAVTLPIAILHLIRFSHRFAGPVLRIRGELQCLAAGERRRPVKFRKQDYWHGLADDFNAVAVMVQQSQANPSETSETEADDAEATLETVGGQA